MTPNRPRGRARSEEHSNARVPIGQGLSRRRPRDRWGRALSLQGLAFFDIHTVFDARPSLTVPRGLAPPSHGLANRLCGLGRIASMLTVAVQVTHG